VSNSICSLCGFDWRRAEACGMKPGDCPCMARTRIYLAIRKAQPSVDGFYAWPGSEVLAYTNPALHPRPTLERAA
jgi:hypothetical protein